MSIALMSRVYTKEVDATTQRVLVLLADHANDEGYCWPSLGLMAWKLGVSPKTVRRNIRALEAAGGVERIGRPGTSNLYRITLDALPDKPAYTPPTGGRTPIDVPPTPPIDVPPTPPTGGRTPLPPVGAKPPVNHQEEPSDKSPTQGAWDCTAAFETFWSAFPSGHGSKKTTREVWKRIKPDRATFDDIMAGLERWKASDRWIRGFVKSAHIWLRDEWWRDDPPPPPARRDRDEPIDDEHLRSMSQEEGEAFYFRDIYGAKET